MTHIAVQIAPSELEAERAHLASLCAQFGANAPSENASCLYQTFDGFELRWERHTEFSTYTFIHRVLGDPLRQPAALTHIPRDWLGKMPGRVTTALHLAFSCADGALDAADLEQYFEKQSLRGGVVRQGTAYLYSSFRLHSDGFGRIVLQAREWSATARTRPIGLRQRMPITTWFANALASSVKRRSRDCSQ